MQNREQATQLYNAAVAAVQPANLIPQYIEVKPDGIHIAGEHIQTNKQSVIVIGAGKAAAAHWRRRPANAAAATAAAAGTDARPHQNHNADRAPHRHRKRV